MEEVGDLAEVNQLIGDTYADLGKARRDGNTELLEARKAEVVILLTERERLLAGTRTETTQAAAAAPPPPQVFGGPVDIKTEVEKALDCTVVIKSPDGARGHGIVVSPTKLLTALHGYFQKNAIFEVVDCHGASRHGFVKETWYEANVVDIALIELNEGSASFDYFMPVRRTSVFLGEDIWAISRRAVACPDEYSEYLEKTYVCCVAKNTALFHSRYYTGKGMFGCVIIASRIGNSFALIGVHVARHDVTTAVEPLSPATASGKKRKRKADEPVTRPQFDDAMMTVNSNILGHGPYSLVCEVARVDGLLAMLST